MTERAPQVELTDVSRIFDVGESAGIRDVSLAIAAGDFVAIVGPSGAGKSTLLNILGLLDRPDSGTYRLAGVDVGPLDEAERDRIRSRDFGFVFQSSFVLGDQSTLRNAALGLRIQGVRMRRRSALARRALARLGIESRWAVPARLLSGGERQRLALARAVAGDPKVLLADEPTGNLDSDNGRVVIEHLRALNKRGVTVVVVTHDGAVAAAASRRIDIRDGLVSEAHDVAPPHPATVSVVANEPLRRWGGKRPPRRRWATAVLDDLADAFTAISSRTLRSALLALAFTLGVGGLIASTGLSETASAQVSDRLTAAALDEVRITVPGGSDLLRAGDDRLENWITAVRELPHVVDVGFLASVPTSVAHIRRIDPSDPAPPSEVFLVAASAGYLEMMGAQDSAGAPSSLLDHPEVTGSAWVGTRAAELLGLASAGPGSTLWAVGREINAVGTFVAGARAPELERVIVVTPDVLADRAGVGVILVVRTEAGFPAVIAEAAPVALDPSNPGRFRVETVADLRDLRFGVANDLGLFVALISALILLLAVISASTTMYISVQARAPEIALRRAVGSSRGGVARLFLAEGLLVGTAGGAAGALVGTLVTLVIAEASGWTPVLPQGLAPLSIGLGVGTGLLSAAIPAWIASRQEPSAAIRG